MALRTRETELRETREELHRSKLLNEALLQEVQSVKGTTPRPAAEKAAATAPIVKTIVIGRQTAGVDDDPTPGDEALQVVVDETQMCVVASQLPEQQALPSAQGSPVIPHDAL